MTALSASLWIGLGGALGSIGRYWLGMLVAELGGAPFPWGTLLINILGSFVIGWFGYLTIAGGLRPAHEDLRLFVIVGLCGGFTTFSAFSLQTMDMLRTGQALPAAAYVAGSVLLCLGATALGRYIALV